ncbi:isochorismatase family protein [Bacillus sp. V5-8f]|uniref:isochorismatase family protein n=1 Tax=Bacillus sp. V5-8f TaxID=2053044 RepID=UPI002155D8D9|nr:isochorismatase family protein [Bacillus sp. V5-8f]
MENNKETAFFEQRGFGKQIGFGDKPAILVIDLIHAFTDYQNPEMVLAADLDQQISETNRLLDAASTLDIPVIYTSVSYDDNFKEAGIWALKQSGVMTLRTNTKAVEVDERLHTNPKHTTIVKKYASAFFGTDMVSRLVSQQVDTVIMTGCTTSGCVRASAVDALSYGFRPMVVEEAVGDRSEAAHKQSLFDLQAKYADVVSVNRVLEYFNMLKQS